MNKQPFYHSIERDIASGRTVFDEDDMKEIERVLTSHPKVINDSIEVYDLETLFTATEDISDELEAQFNNKVTIVAEAGDPADLM